MGSLKNIEEADAPDPFFPLLVVSVASKIGLAARERDRQNL